METQPNPILNLIPIAVIFLIFYFLLIRPQQKQVKKHEKMLEDLKKGDKILTNGGLYGTIVGVKGKDLEVRFSEKVKLYVARTGITKLITDAQNTPAKNGTSAS